MKTPAGVYSTLNQSDLFDSATLKDLEVFTLSMFPGKDALKDVSAHHLWNTIFNVVVDPNDKSDRDRSIASYTS